MRVDERTRRLQASSSDAVLAVHVEPSEDMVVERRKATFDAQQLEAELCGGVEAVKRRSVSYRERWGGGGSVVSFL